MKDIKDFLDPRTKLILLFVTSICVFMNRSIWNEVLFILVPSVLMFIYNKKNISILKYVTFFFVLMAIQEFIVPILPTNIGGIIYVFTLYVRKLVPCVMNGKLLIDTTRVSHFLVTITRLKLPPGFIISSAVGLRYFPTLKEEYKSIKQAMILRGISCSVPALITHPLQAMEYIYVPILVSASRIADEISQAAITRGIENIDNRESIIEIGFSTSDYIVWGISLVLFCTTLISMI